MNPDDIGAVQDADGGGGYRAEEPFINRDVAEDFADGGFPGGSQENRFPKDLEFIEPAEQFKVLRYRFPETETRIKNDIPWRDANCGGDGDRTS